MESTEKDRRYIRSLCYVNLEQETSGFSSAHGLILSRGQRRAMNAIEHYIAHQPKPHFTGPRRLPYNRSRAMASSFRAELK